MIDLIRLGGTLERGGEVLAASADMRYGGRPVARLGDAVKCRRHPDVHPNEIAQGDAAITDHGVPCARNGHQASCGCRLITRIA
ncbi:PAAR domain-containing protein [Burkholderia sp. 22PA0106]|uniref:PAAR domain-containing protein n=1 Tax=Burkholderia sp. 22PA0106 TaxID=3237371 RepID=UPI0039C432C7